jgi:hypothetical protein
LEIGNLNGAGRFCDGVWGDRKFEALFKAVSRFFRNSFYCRTIDTTLTFTGSNDYLELRSDNTYTLSSDEDWGVAKKAVPKSASAMTEEGAWSLSGSTLTLTPTIGEAYTLTVSQNGSSATFTESFSEYDPDFDMTMTGTIVLHATKQ